MQTDWHNLIKEIERGKCAIFLGHGLLSDPADMKPLYSKFCDQLAVEYSDLIHSYYPEENFFLFKAQKDRRKFTNRIDDFYQSMQPDVELYQKLAEIPVSLYISVSPDDFLKKAIGDAAQVVVFGDQDNKGQQIEATKEAPLLYYIFGTRNDGGSLLLSHDDLFEFFKNILSEHTLPATIKKFFKEDAGGEVIFLGFSFKKWYLQLLLRLFNLSKRDNELNRTAYLYNDPQEDEKVFATQQFQIEYVETHIKEFVNTLHEKCAEKGILRKPKSANAEAAATLVEDKAARVEEVKRQLVTANKLRNEWEEKMVFSDDPKERMKCEMEIAKLVTQIDCSREELKSLSA